MTEVKKHLQLKGLTLFKFICITRSDFESVIWKVLEEDVKEGTTKK